MKKIQIGGHLRSAIKGYALVDNEDFDWLNKYKWQMSGKGYPVIPCPDVKKKRQIFMHEVLIYKFPQMVTDHIDRNKLNNQKSNLRIVNFSQNAANIRRKSNNTSGYPGVHWHKRDRRWIARMSYEGKVILKRYCNSKSEAIEIRRLAEKEFWPWKKL